MINSTSIEGYHTIIKDSSEFTSNLPSALYAVRITGYALGNTLRTVLEESKWKRIIIRVYSINEDSPSAEGFVTEWVGVPILRNVTSVFEYDTKREKKKIPHADPPMLLYLEKGHRYIFRVFIYDTALYNSVYGHEFNIQVAMKIFPLHMGYKLIDQPSRKEYMISDLNYDLADRNREFMHNIKIGIIGSIVVIFMIILLIK